MCLMDIYLTVESIHSTCLLFHGTDIFFTMSGAASDETTIEIDREFTQIIWIVFGKRVQKTFLLMPDWDITFIQNPPTIIFNKTPHHLVRKLF